MAEVVAQLSEVRERLAAGAMVAMRAKADAEQAHQKYVEAATGTAHPQLQEAITDIRAAAEKAARTARLLTKARAHFTTYLNKIAPGSASDSDVSAAELPSGEDLVGEAQRRADSSSNVGAFLNRMSRKVEEIQDAGKSATEVAQATIRVIKSPFKPPAAQATSTATRSPAQPTFLQRIDAPETVGHILVLGVLAGLSIRKTTHLARTAIERFRSGGRKK